MPIALRHVVASRSRRAFRIASAAGFTLIEALAAVVLVMIAAAAVAQLLIAAWRASTTAAQLAVARQVAREKIEEMRALEWTADAGAPVTDWSSDLTRTPVAPAGGTGLGASPPGTLLSNIQGYCDFVGADGRWLAGSDRVPADAAWVRRWAIEMVAGVSDTLLLQVVVVPAQRSLDPSAVVSMKAADGVRLLTIRTRASR